MSCCTLFDDAIYQCLWLKVHCSIFLNVIDGSFIVMKQAIMLRDLQFNFLPKKYISVNANLTMHIPDWVMFFFIFNTHLIDALTLFAADNFHNLLMNLWYVHSCYIRCWYFCIVTYYFLNKSSESHQWHDFAYQTLLFIEKSLIYLQVSSSRLERFPKFKVIFGRIYKESNYKKNISRQNWIKYTFY